MLRLREYDWLKLRFENARLRALRYQSLRQANQNKSFGISDFFEKTEKMKLSKTVKII